MSNKEVPTTRSFSEKQSDINTTLVKVEFAPDVRAALGELAAATDDSLQFRPRIHGIIEKWATEPPSSKQLPSLEEVISSLPLIANEVHKHVQTTGDQNAKRAWEDFSEALSLGSFRTVDCRQRWR